MDATLASGGGLDAYRVLSDLGGVIGGLLALLAAVIVYLGARHQARVVRDAAEAQLLAMREQMAQQQRSRDAEDERRRDELRFALAGEAARVGELAAHRYRIIPLEYGPGRLETVARSACDIFKVHAASILRRNRAASALLGKDIVAAAGALDDAVDALNSLLAVEGALGRLPAVELLTAFENVMQAAKSLRIATNGAEPTPRVPRRVAELLGAAEG